MNPTSWSFTHRIAAVAALAAAAVILVSLASFQALRTVTESSNDVINQYARDVIDAKDLETAFDRRLLYMRDFVISGTEAYLEDMTRADADFHAALARLHSRPRSPEGQTLIADIEQLETEHHAIADELVGMRRADMPVDEIDRYLRRRGHPRRVRIEDDLRQFVAFKQQKMATAQAESEAAARRQQRLLILIASLTFLLAGSLTYLLVRALSRAYRAELVRREEAELASRILAESEGRLQAVLDHSPACIWVKDAQGRFQLINRRFEELFGIDPRTFIGKTDFDIFPRQHAQEFIEHDRAVLARGQPLEFEERVPQPAGDRTFMAVKFPLFDADGRAALVCGIATDVTDRRRAEAALRNSEKLAATGRMAASIAHEINNPLEAVTNLLYLLARHDGLDPVARAYVEMAETEVGRVSHIAKQTLAFYRDTTAARVRLDELLDGVLHFYSHQVHQKRITVDKRYGFTAPIQTFAGELRQALSNIVLNALEALPEESRLTVAVRRARIGSNGDKKDAVRILLADNGHGIAPQHVPHIFEPFFTTKGEKGTGLGLWVTRGIVDKLGGRLRVRTSSVPGRSYTVFSILLRAEAAPTAIAAGAGNGSGKSLPSANDENVA